MDRKEKVKMQDEYLDIMIKNLPVLRASVNLTQAQLAEKVGISRQTVVGIETRKRPLAWSLYLAMICVFEQYEESEILLNKLELFSSVFLKEM